MSIGKAIKWAVTTASVILVALVFVPCVRDFIANSRHLRQMEDALHAIPPPQETVQLATRSAVGLLVGNGNHCDFFVGTVFRSSTKAGAIRQHYAGRSFLNPVTRLQEPPEVTFLTNRLDLSSVWLPDGLERIEAWGLSEKDLTQGTVYLLNIMRSYRANHDCRCH